MSFRKAIRVLFFFEENNFSERLATELKAKGNLLQRCRTKDLSVLENLSFATRATNANAALSDIVEKRETIGLFKEKPRVREPL